VIRSLASPATIPAIPARPRLRSIRTRLAVPLLGLVSLLALAASARAHDPYESFHAAVIYPDRLELVVTMAASTALKLIDPAAIPPDLTAESFAALRPHLLRAATALCALSTAQKTLPPRTATVELTDENDIVFRVIYPPPGPGRLRLTAAYLEKLGDGYGGLLELTDHRHQNLGWEQLLWAHPHFELTLPPTPPAIP
jgi:hypothetical protein